MNFWLASACFKRTALWTCPLQRQREGIVSKGRGTAATSTSASLSRFQPCHPTTSPPCHPTTSPYHLATLPLCHPTTSLPRHPTALPPCHLSLYSSLSVYFSCLYIYLPPPPPSLPRALQFAFVACLCLVSTTRLLDLSSLEGEGGSIVREGRGRELYVKGEGGDIVGEGRGRMYCK